MCLVIIALFCVPLAGPANAGKRRGSRNINPPLNQPDCYLVKKGDTLYSISRKTGIAVNRIAALNQLGTGIQIHPGLIVKLPPTVVDRGQTTSNRRSIVFPASKVPLSGKKPHFQWPLKQMVGFQQDGREGIRSLGIFIIGRPGVAVLSSADGVVKKIGHMRGYGNYIVIAHADRFTTVYANIGQITVNEGESITAGTIIGRITQQDPKLHFQIDLAGRPENPIRYLPERNRG